MDKTLILCVVAITTSLLGVPAHAEENPGDEGLLKRAAKVDKPISDTYEPLNSSYMDKGEELNETIEQSWELKKQAREREEAAKAVGSSPERQALEQRIQEPGGKQAVQPEPQVRDTGTALEIKGD